MKDRQKFRAVSDAVNNQETRRKFQEDGVFAIPTSLDKYLHPHSASSYAALVEKEEKEKAEQEKAKTKQEKTQQSIAIWAAYSEFFNMDQKTETKSISKLDKKTLKAANKKESFPFFNKVPEDVLKNYVLPFLSIEKNRQMIVNLARISKSTSSQLFQNYLGQEKKKIRKFLDNIIQGRLGPITDMLFTSDPATRWKLFTTSMEVKDLFGNSIKGNAVELIMYSNDSQMLREIYLLTLPEEKALFDKKLNAGTSSAPNRF